MLRVNVQLEVTAATALHRRGPPTPASRAVTRAAEELGVALEPVHPGSDDPTLVPHFTVSVPDAASADRVLTRLRDCPGVEAAYVKPPEEPA